MKLPKAAKRGNYTLVMPVILFNDMARPRSIDKTGKHAGSRLVALRITETQYEKLCKKAARKGCTISELLRQSVLGESSAA
jgi:hypothetical protein